MIALIKRFEINYTRGCPIGNLSKEMGDLSDAFSNKLSVSVELISGIYKDLLDEAKKINLISHGIDSQKTAEFIVSSWHGSLIKNENRQKYCVFEASQTIYL